MDKREKIKEVVRLTYLSGFLIKEKPISLMLIAPPENSKTHFIFGYKSKNAHVSTDLSFQGLLKVLLEKKNIKHIVIGDFLKITGKKQSTKNNILTLLNAYTEEGIYDINLGNKDKLDFKGKNGGLITATTTNSFIQNKKSWDSLGFSSRFLLIKYKFSESTMEEILDKIIDEDSKVTTEQISAKKMKINCPMEIKKKLKKHCFNSPRKLKILIVLLKTIALKNNHPIVLKSDFEELQELFEVLTEREIKI